MALPALHGRALHPGAADSLPPVAASQARGRPICRAATVTAPPPPPTPLQRRWGGDSGGKAGSGAAPSSSDSLGAFPISGSWQGYSRQVPGLPLSPVDAVLEQLRRQLGAGDRWAWQLNAEEEAAGEDSEEEEAVEAEEEASSTSSSSASAAVGTAGRQATPVVLSSRGAGRRSGSRRQCRGRALAGAALCEQARPWGHASDPLPPELQACQPGLLLSARQEALLGELVQAAKRAQQQQQQQPEHSEAALRRGSAAQQLLFDCNLRLVLHTRRQLLGSVQLPESLHQELCNAGRDALRRAAGGYQPSRHTRFSTYACAAILNGLRDVLRQQQSQLVHVPRQARGWAAQVQAAAGVLQQQQQQHHHHHHQQQQQPPPEQPPPRLAQLAAAAQLQPRQVLLGLAAARPQRLASFSCAVPVEAAAGACSRNKQQQLAPFGDVQEEGEEEAEDGAAVAAQEAVQLLLPRLRPSKHSQVLRLRFGLDGGSSSSGPAAAAGEEVDFTTMGSQLGVSRQRAAQLYHAAVTSARQTAAASGMRQPRAARPAQDAADAAAGALYN